MLNLDLFQTIEILTTEEYYVVQADALHIHVEQQTDMAAQ